MHGEGLWCVPQSAGWTLEREGMWVKGVRARWIHTRTNPAATAEFVLRFPNPPADYMHAYGMMIAEQLPDLPEAVDGKDPAVQQIVHGIMEVAGEWIAYESAKRVVVDIEECEPPLAAARSEHKRLVSLCEDKDLELETQQEAIDDEKEQLEEIAGNIQDTKGKINNFWSNDSLNCKANYEESISKMAECTSRDWYNLKATTSPSTMVKVLADAVCMIFQQEIDWKVAQSFFQNSETNSNQGDLEALVEPYDVKIIHELTRSDEKKFSIYTIAEQKERIQTLSMKVYDPGFRYGRHSKL
eukprot:g5210.t1